MSGRWAKAGSAIAERPEQQDVLGRVRQVVLAPDDVADLHRGVVDDDREVVQRRAVAADDDEVATEVDDIDLDPAADDVVEADHAGPDAEPDRRGTPLGLAGGAFLRRQGGASPDVARRLLGRLLGLPVGVELLGRAVAVIGLVGGQETFRGLGVQRQPEHLAVRRERTAGRLAGDLRSLVPVQAEPVQSVEDVLLVGDRTARLVGVLETEDERPADVAREEVVEQGGPRGPDVERPGRARGDADARRGHPRLGTWWNRAGSASPGRTRTSAAGRRPRVARPRGPSSVSESSDSLRARIVIAAPGVSARASR